ncbi:MAG TPA: hypothetical protein VKV18_02385 [Chthonomonas sp.]|uniref:hypothetical protein n=1 Tax=Chthonomonas sp. TaxID=2282153 RepID=UPI002B4B23A5|nr:hypothetical protein [Chthonomonas sp.]HLI47526.1 hypothetical protein [Chthonomonas sp.]
MLNIPTDPLAPMRFLTSNTYRLPFLMDQPARETGSPASSKNSSEIQGWVVVLLPFRQEDRSCRWTTIELPQNTETFVPKTPLGRKLLAIREQAIQAGMTLWSVDEVLEEVRRRRGEGESVGLKGSRPHGGQDENDTNLR